MGKLKERFENKYSIDEATGCWNWNAYTRPDGYGGFSVERKEKTAHRVSYELYVGPIPDGLHIDHLCVNRLCVNPNHLEPVTQAENNRRSSKTHKICEHGIGYSQCKESCGKEYRARKARERHSEKRNEYMREYNKRKKAEKL